MLALKTGAGLEAALVKAADAACDLDLELDFERIRRRVAEIAPEMRPAIGALVSRERFAVRAIGGLEAIYVEHFADVLESVLAAYDELFGFAEFSKLPGKKLRVRLHLESKIERPPHFAPQFPFNSEVDFPVADASAFTSPTADGLECAQGRVLSLSAAASSARVGKSTVVARTTSLPAWSSSRFSRSLTRNAVMNTWGCLSRLAATAVLVAAARANVWVVDDNGPANFSTIQDAINAASDGDTIIVQPGNYTSFTINDKDLRVLGTGAQKPLVVGASQVTSLASQRAVVLSDLRFQLAPASAWALQLTNCAGAVRVQRCNAKGANGPGGSSCGACTSTGHGVRVSGSPNVVLSEFSAQGGSSGQCGSGSNPSGCSVSGGQGAWITSSALATFDCDFTGGNAGASTDFSGASTGRGGDGFRAEGSFVFASTSPMSGGTGGGFLPSNWVCFNNSRYEQLGRGGHGCSFESTLTSSAWFVKPTLTAGDYGATNCSYTFDEWPPAKFFKRGPPGSTAARVVGQLRTSDMPAFQGSTNVVSAIFEGAAGDVVEVFVSPQPDFVWNLPQRGVWSLSLAAALPPTIAGTIQSSGQLVASISLPPLQAKQSNQTWYVQPLFHNAAGSFLGSPSAVTLVP